MPDDNLIERVFPGATERAKRNARWRARGVVRFIQVVALMMATGIAIPVLMISLGLLFGPKGYEGVFITPLAIMVSWALIIFWGFKGRVTKKQIARSPPAALPDRTIDWLEQQRGVMPAEALRPLDGIEAHLETLKPQVEALPADSPAGAQLRRLLVDDLTPLVDDYRRLPRRLQQKPLHGGASPEERLVAGLSTIEGELARVQERLAGDSLYSLATKQRYLELKYSGKKRRS